MTEDSRTKSPTPRCSKIEDRTEVTPIKPPWKSPIHQDFTLKTKPVFRSSHSPRFSPTEKSISPPITISSGSEPEPQCLITDQLDSMSMDSLSGSSSGLRPGTSGNLSRSWQQRCTARRGSSRKGRLEAKDEVLNYRYYGSMPLFARSCFSFPSASSDDGVEDTTDAVRCIANFSFEDLYPMKSKFVLKQPSSDCPGYIDKTSVHQGTRLPSPNVSPRLWLRKEESSINTPMQNTSVPMLVATEPFNTKDNGKLYLVFGHDVTAGIYEVELEANLTLQKPDRSGWQSFEVAGLPSNEGKDTTGGFEFVVKPEVDNLDLLEFQYDTSRLLDARTLGSRELVARFRLSEPLLLRLRAKERIHDIDDWNTAVTLYTVPKWSTNEGTHVKHHASLTFELPDRDIFAEKVKFSIVVKYGPSKDHNCSLEADESSVSLAEDDKLESSPGPHSSEAEITIIRSMQNLDNSIHLYFVRSYPDTEYVSISLPTFRPKLGKVLSESIMLLKASPPLFLEHLGRGQFSKWKLSEHYKSEETWMCLDRVEVSPLFPEGLKDDAMVRIRKLWPVHYEALDASDEPLSPEHPSNVVKELDVRIERVFGEGLECRMSVEIQVGSSCRLLTVDDHDWTPMFFVIDGQLATQKAGEWRENEEGYKTLFKSSAMTLGQTLRLEMHWKELVISDEFRGEGMEQNKMEYKIPRILGKIILGGTLLCRIDEGT